MEADISEIYHTRLNFLEKLIEEAKEVLTEDDDENRYHYVIKEIRNVVINFKDYSNKIKTMSLIDKAFNPRLNDFNKYTSKQFDALVLLLHAEKDPQIIIIPTKGKMLELAGISNRHDESTVSQYF